MAAVTTTNPADFANRVQTLFNPKLLESLKFNLKLASFGLSEGYTTIGSAIRFFRPRKANQTGIVAQAITQNITPLITPTVLTEGVKPTVLTEVAIGYLDINLGQRGALTSLTDRMQAIDLVNTVKVYSTTMGDDAALDYDSVIRNSLVNGVYNSNATYSTGFNDGGFFERFAGVQNTGNSATDFTSLAGQSQAAGKFTRFEHVKCITQLKTSKIPKINGQYPVITAPQVIQDIRLDTTWTQIGTFQKADDLYKDGALMLDGGAFIEANNPWVEAGTYGTESATQPANGFVFSTIYLGKDAFGLPNLTNKQAGGSQSAPKLVILNNPDKSDPLNQTTLIGWKSYFGSAPFITNLSGEYPRLLVLRSKSTFA